MSIAQTNESAAPLIYFSSSLNVLRTPPPTVPGHAPPGIPSTRLSFLSHTDSGTVSFPRLGEITFSPPFPSFPHSPPACKNASRRFLGRLQAACPAAQSQHIPSLSFRLQIFLRLLLPAITTRPRIPCFVFPCKHLLSIFDTMALSAGLC